MGCTPLIQMKGKKKKVVGFICSPTPREQAKKIYKCRKCKRRRLHLVKFYEWYGPDARCLTCDNFISLE